MCVCLEYIHTFKMGLGLFVDLILINTYKECGFINLLITNNLITIEKLIENVILNLV